MSGNKSYHYLLPLIEGWSAKAGRPINCFAFSNFTDSLICIYKDEVPRHNREIEVETNIAGPSSKVKAFAYKYMPEYMDDIELIMAGKYSQISNDCKSLILDRTHEYDYEGVEEVLFKRDRRRLELNNKLAMDITEYCDEYESKFGKEEVCKVKLLEEQMSP